MEKTLKSICVACEQEIDSEVCWCGEYIDKHDIGSGHSPIEMGCACNFPVDIDDLIVCDGHWIDNLLGDA
jgi:hypothetical protein